MLKICKLVILGCCLYSNFAIAQSFTPTPQQIQQFQNMPRSQQIALAQQLGIDITQFQVNDNSEANETEEETVVEREVDNEKVAEELAKQSAAQELTKELKPFGYDVFSSSPTAFAPTTNIPVPNDYIMGPGDSINVRLFGKESGEFSLVVNNEGGIQVPELGPLSVAGLTYKELKAKLVDLYAEQVIGVTPHITMGDLKTIQVFIVGEAFKPGAYTLSSLSTITHALFSSGGVSNIGSLRNIQLKRKGKAPLNFDLYDMLIFGNVEQDVRLQQGDVIFIPPIRKLVSIDGEVRRPAIYEVKQDESLATLIDFAGGILPSGAANKVQVTSQTSGQGLTLSSIDVSQSISISYALKNGDFITVPKTSTDFENAVLLIGAHQNPGLIQWRQSLSVDDVIDRSLLLNETDLDYGLLVRRSKYDRQSTIYQFQPRAVMAGEWDMQLQPRDQILLFNEFGADTGDALEIAVTAGNLNTSQDDLKTEQSEFLMDLEFEAFTDKQIDLLETQRFSRKQLLAPVIARLKSEGFQDNPVQLVEINGQVRFPGVYPIPREGRIKDLVMAAGGLLEAAFLPKAELTRSEIDSDGSFRVNHSDINLIDVLLADNTENVNLMSKDKLNVLRIPEWYENRRVELLGEVVFPGIYSIKKNESLNDLIARAGGLTAEASPNAAVFTREELKEREELHKEKTVEALRQQIASSNFSASQNVKTIDFDQAQEILNELLSVESVGRLVIDLPNLLNAPAGNQFELKDGDKLVIPSISKAISVVGEVFVPATHLFDQSVLLEDYIEQSGGFTEQADSGRVYIVKANGSVKIPQNNFWFVGEQELILEPGDTIVVPRDVTNYERLAVWQTATQIIYQAAVALLAVQSI